MIPGHGGQRRCFAQRYGIPEDEILDFSVNVSPLALPDEILDFCRKEINKTLHLYPEPYAREFCEFVAGIYGCGPEQITAGHGALGLLETLVRALAPKTALLVQPCFSEYRRILENQGCGIREVYLPETRRFAFPCAEVIEPMPRIALLILGHPNNPTGSALSLDKAKEIMRQAEKHRVFVVVDEAFADWCPEISLSGYVHNEKPLAVVRSLTKFYGLA